jgi:hypothetical protein
VKEMDPASRAKILQWVQVASPQITKEDGAWWEPAAYSWSQQVPRGFADAYRKLGLGEDVPFLGVESEFGSLPEGERNIAPLAAEMSDFVYGRVETVPFEGDRWTSPQAREAVEQDVEDEIFRRLVRDSSSFGGFPDEDKLRGQAKADTDRILTLMPKAHRIAQEDAAERINTFKAYMALQPRVQYEGNRVKYFGSQVATVGVDLAAIFAATAATAKAGGVGGIAYSYTRFAPDLEIQLIDAGVTPTNAEGIANAFAVPYILADRVSLSLLKLDPGTKAAITQKIGNTAAGKAVSQFAKRVAPKGAAAMEQKLLTDLQREWGRHAATNLKRVMTQRALKATGEIGQEIFQEAVDGAAKSFAIEFAEANGLNHEQVWWPRPRTPCSRKARPNASPR